MKKIYLLVLLGLLIFSLTRISFASPPYIEHAMAYFPDGEILITECQSKAETAFSKLNITVKKTTNPENEVVGFTGNYKVVLYCIEVEAGCEMPEKPYAGAARVIVAGPKYTKVKRLGLDVLKKMEMNIEE
ncbi:secreted protein [Beggiatoa sp. PS]|nr:secreted protein [Beggiatoa sp. PS]